MVGPRVALRELAQEHLEAIAGIEAVSSSAPWSRELFAGELSMPVQERHWLVALVDDCDRAELAVGFAGSMIIADEAHIMNIAVAPEQRRRGIARVLLTQMLDDLIQRNVRHVTLEVGVENHAARSLYALFGFTVEGERRDYYGPGLHASILWARNIDRSSDRSPNKREVRP